MNRVLPVGENLAIWPKGYILIGPTRMIECVQCMIAEVLKVELLARLIELHEQHALAIR